MQRTALHSMFSQIYPLPCGFKLHQENFLQIAASIFGFENARNTNAEWEQNGLEFHACKKVIPDSLVGLFQHLGTKNGLRSNLQDFSGVAYPQTSLPYTYKHTQH